jgi:L-aspartate oxidase
MTTELTTAPYGLVVIGSGIAGMIAAPTASTDGRRVALLSKEAFASGSSSSWLAQGGIAAAICGNDDPQLHAADTLAAGRNPCRESAVRLLTQEAPARVVDLADLCQPMRFEQWI